VSRGRKVGCFEAKCLHGVCNDGWHS
jgi:hypothetical protein